MPSAIITMCPLALVDTYQRSKWASMLHTTTSARKQPIPMHPPRSHTDRRSPPAPSSRAQTKPHHTTLSHPDLYQDPKAHYQHPSQQSPYHPTGKRATPSPSAYPTGSRTPSNPRAFLTQYTPPHHLPRHSEPFTISSISIKRVTASQKSLLSRGSHCTVHRARR